MKKSLDWKISITRGEDGFLLAHKEELDDGYIKTRYNLFEENDSPAAVWASLVYFLLDYFGETNLTIDIKEQEK